MDDILIWICEYSIKQKCFHVAPKNEHLIVNTAMIIQGKQPEFSPIAEFSSREDAIEFSEKLRMEMPEVFG